MTNWRSVPIGDIKPNPNNPRIIKDDKFKKLVQSIKDFPEMLKLRPIVVNAEMVVLGGNMRLKACQAAGLTEVPVILASGLTDERQREFIIKDNVGFGEWEWETLANEWDADDLAAWGLDLPEFEKAPADGLTDADEVPESPAEPVSVLGDLWLLGKHRVLCGDSTSVDAVKRLMSEEKADILISDPPYGIGYQYEEHNDASNEDNAELVARAFDNGPDIKAWTPGLMNLSRDMHRFGKAKVAVWFKKFAAAGNGLGGASVWEPILITGKPKVKKLKTDVIVCMTDRVTVDGKSLRELHSCPKPVELYATLIESLSAPSDIVFEPFCGSGTTLIASEKTGRQCRAIEITPTYVDVIVKRWQDFTGKDAIHSVTGETFNSMASSNERTANGKSTR